MISHFYLFVVASRLPVLPLCPPQGGGQRISPFKGGQRGFHRGGTACAGSRVSHPRRKWDTCVPGRLPLPPQGGGTALFDAGEMSAGSGQRFQTLGIALQRSEALPTIADEVALCRFEGVPPSTQVRHLRSRRLPLPPSQRGTAMEEAQRGTAHLPL